MSMRFLKEPTVIQGSFVDSIIYANYIFLLTDNNSVEIRSSKKNTVISTLEIPSNEFCYSLEVYNYNLYIYDGYKIYSYSVKDVLNKHKETSKRIDQIGYNFSVNSRGILFAEGMNGVSFYNQKENKIKKVDSIECEVQDIDSRPNRALCNSDFNTSYTLIYKDNILENNWVKGKQDFENGQLIKYITNSKFFILDKRENMLTYNNDQFQKEQFSFYPVKGAIVDAAATEKLRVIELENNLVISPSRQIGDEDWYNINMSDENNKSEVINWKVFPKSKAYSEQVHVIKTNQLEILTTKEDIIKYPNIKKVY